MLANETVRTGVVEPTASLRSIPNPVEVTAASTATPQAMARRRLDRDVVGAGRPGCQGMAALPSGHFVPL